MLKKNRQEHKNEALDNCPVDSSRMKKYLKNAGFWVIVFYCVKGTAVTAGAIVVAFLAL